MNNIARGLVALLIAAVISLAGVQSASADVRSDLGPAPTNYTVTGIYGHPATGFFVRYYNGTVKVFSPIKSALQNADDGAERRMVRAHYKRLAAYQRTLQEFGANDLF